MKKLIAILLFLALSVFGLVSCDTNDTAQLHVGYLTGPTGVGMAKLIHDNGGYESGNEKYVFKNYANDSTKAQADLTAGNIDIICVPTNNIASYYNSQDKNIQVLSINTLGSLYLVSKTGIEINSLEDLEGKTIYTCQKGTPKTVIDKILEKAGINATVSYTVGETVIDEPNKIGPQIIKGDIDIAVAPEPIISNALSKNSNFSVKLNLGDIWEAEFGSELAMGCIVTTKTFMNEHENAVKRFMNEYKSSISFMSNPENLEQAAEYAIEESILPFDKEIVKNAISNLGEAIAYIDGENMKNILKSFYSTINLPSPDDEFYYAK